MNKSKRKAAIIVKRQYTGNKDMEKAFTEVLTRALVKLPPRTPPPPIPRTPKILL